MGWFTSLSFGFKYRALPASEYELASEVITPSLGKTLEGLVTIIHNTAQPVTAAALAEVVS